MIPALPFWIDVLFILVFILTLAFFYFANNKPNKIIAIIILWGIIHSILAYIGFYQDTSMPPRFGLVLIPAAIAIIYACTGRRIEFILYNRNTKISTFLHTIRIPMEIILLHLFLNGWIPELMTYHGRNFDIIAGVLALSVGMLNWKGKVSRMGLILFNIIGLILILFILVNGLLSAELPFQQFAFDQPNKAVSFFPYILLAAVIVPMVIYTHISDLIYLLNKKAIN